MRFLFCSVDSPGFLYPEIGLAKELAKRGHEVAFATNIDCKETLDRHGLQRLPRGPNDGRSFQISSWGQAPSVAIQVKHVEYALDRFPADVLVGQTLTNGSLLVGERRQLPVGLLGLCTYLWPAHDEPNGVRSSSSPGNVEDVAGWRTWRHDGMLETLNQARALFRLPPQDRGCRDSPLLGDLFLLQSVPELEPDHRDLPERVHLVGSCLWEPSEEDLELEKWLDEAEASGAPILYVQHGRFFHIPSFWPQLVEALGGTSFRVLASTDRLDSQIGPVPDNFLVRSHIPQGWVLQRARAVIATANTTAVLGAFTHGVPCLLIPGGGEQPDVAMLGKRAGIAQILLPNQTTAEALRNGVEKLISDPVYRANALLYRSAFSRMDGLRNAADLLEILGQMRRPILRSSIQERDEPRRHRHQHHSIASKRGMSGAGMSAPPLIVRLAGLPAQALEPLTSPPCIALLQAREPLEKELGEARRSMVEAIGDALPGFDVANRRFLLAVKRSCFNGRDIETYRRRAEWTSLLRVSSDLAERIVALEEQLRENDRALTALHASELARERRHVLALTQDRRFLRGVALGRPGLVQKIRARVPSFAASGSLKNPEKWELSLLRFVTRAAAKLSANSTLTAYALGSLQSSPSSTDYRFAGSPQREVSLVRVNRPELEQFQALLMRHPAVREHAFVAWNDSVEELEPGRYRYVRDGYWNLDPGAEGFHFVRPARVTVELSNPLLGAARDAFREGALRYGELLALLEDRSALDQLIDLGLLILMPPWPAYEARLEQRIGQFLRALPDALDVRATADALDELLALEKGFASAPRPESSVARMEDAFSRLLDTVVHLAHHEGSVTSRASFFEDVLFEPTLSLDDDRGILQIASPAVQEILRSAGLISRFAGLFNHRHDILHTLAAWWRDHEPDRREVPFTEIVQGFAPLWKQFLSFHKTANESPLNTFDPLHAEALETLRERREALLAQSKELVSRSPTKDLLPVQQLAEILQALPHRYTPLLGPCVFVQPVDAEGSSWVLNRLHEGVGRYLSRVTPILEGPLQQRFLNHLIARSVVDLEGEAADLLEIMHPWGSLVTAHPPQASKVLDIRGLHLDLPRQRRVSLGDLTIQADLESETFRLVDSSGRRLLPVHLSSMTDAGLPPLLRLLLMFGPGETRSVFPFAHSEGDEDFRIFKRLTCGRLVLRRRRWAIGIESLRGDLEDLGDSRAYANIHRWRHRLDLPSVGFYYERTHHGAVKPQHVDFTSPSLCGLFVSSLRKMTTGHLLFEEALPSPADFPFDASMNRRGLELLVDSLAIRTVRGNSSAGVLSHDRESNSLGKER